MDREILFRGQTRRYGEKVNMNGEKLPGRWVYGGVIQGKGDFSIIYGGECPNDIEKHVVYTDTLGQYTGQTDCENEIKIFEDDILESQIDKHRRFMVGYFDGQYLVREIEGKGESFSLSSANIVWFCLKRVGNIHDGKDGEKYDGQ